LLTTTKLGTTKLGTNNSIKHASIKHAYVHISTYPSHKQAHISPIGQRSQGWALIPFCNAPPKGAGASPPWMLSQGRPQGYMNLLTLTIAAETLITV